MNENPGPKQFVFLVPGSTRSHQLWSPGREPCSNFLARLRRSSLPLPAVAAIWRSSTATSARRLRMTSDLVLARSTRLCAAAPSSSYRRPKFSVHILVSPQP